MNASLVAGLAVYVVFITNFFRTRISFHTPWERYAQHLNSSEYMRHAVDTGRYERKICAFGRDVGMLIGVLLILRAESVHAQLVTKRQAVYASSVMWGAALLGGLALNFNFTMYLLPAACVDLGVQLTAQQKSG